MSCSSPQRLCIAPIAWLLSISAPDAVAADTRFASERNLCRSLVGSYLTTVLDQDGEFASRSLVTINGDGTLAVVDSGQEAGITGGSFSAQQGAYRCNRRRGAKAITVNFGFPDHVDLARIDWDIRVAPDRSIEGSFTVNVFTPLATCNPFDPEATCTLTDHATFRFTSVRVPAALE